MKLRTVVSHPHSFRLHPSPFVVAPSACGYAFPVQKRKVPACEGGLGGQRGRRNDTPNRRGSPRSWIWQGKGPHGPGVTGHVPRCVASIAGTLRAKNLPIVWLERPGQDSLDPYEEYVLGVFDTLVLPLLNSEIGCLEDPFKLRPPNPYAMGER